MSWLDFGGERSKVKVTRGQKLAQVFIQCGWRRLAVDFTVFVTEARQERLLLSPTAHEHNCLQCFDAVGWMAGRTSGL